MINYSQIGTIVYKDQNYKILKIKEIYIQQENLKNNLLQDLKGVFEMKKQFEEYNNFCIRHKLKPCRYESLKKFLNLKKGDKDKCC